MEAESWMQFIQISQEANYNLRKDKENRCRVKKVQNRTEKRWIRERKEEDRA